MKQASEIRPPIAQSRGNEKIIVLLMLFAKSSHNSIPSPLITLLTHVYDQLGITTFVFIIILWCIKGQASALIPIAVSNFH